MVGICVPHGEFPCLAFHCQSMRTSREEAAETTKSNCNARAQQPQVDEKTIRKFQRRTSIAQLIETVND